MACTVSKMQTKKRKKTYGSLCCDAVLAAENVDIFRHLTADFKFALFQIVLIVFIYIFI